MSSRRPIDQITHIIVHCSASPNGRNNTAADIDEWHGPGRQRQGLVPFRRDPEVAPYHRPDLKHIGYHIINRVDGRVEYGRSFRETGAHCREQRMNHVSVGILMIGFNQFTAAQWDNLRKQVAALRFALGPLPVLGHRQINPLKTCPGFDVPSWEANGFQPNPENILELQAA